MKSKLITKPFKSRLFHSFTLCLLFAVTNLYSQNISTVREVFDFEIGDIFHRQAYTYYEENRTVTIDNKSIEDKFYSTSGDTLSYVIYTTYQRRILEPISTEWEYGSRTDTVYYTQLDSLIRSGDIDSAFKDVELYNNRKINHRNFFVPKDYSMTEYEYGYVDGCGLAYYHFREMWVKGVHNFFDEQQLGNGYRIIYFKKGDEEWGGPLYVGIEESKPYSLTVSIFPNPAKDYLNIEVQNFDECHGEIYTLFGKTIKTFGITSKLTRIDLSDINPGIYFLIIRYKGELFSTKLIVN